MSKNNAWNYLQPLFRPKAIAIVGASVKGGTGMQVIRNLKQVRFTGKIIPINPKYNEIAGYRCYPSLTEATAQGEKIEMVAILLGKKNILGVLQEAASVGIHAAWSFASGFTEMGGEGTRMQEEIVSFCKENEIRLLGPNCVGYLNPSVGVGTYSAPAPTEIRKGNIGMVAQSGYLTLAVANSQRGLGFSMLVSTGNEAVVDSTDVMEYMLEDEETHVIMAFIEQFRNPSKLIEVAKKAKQLHKPIVLIKVGKSQMARRATAAHTGALAGSDAVQDAIFRKYGIIRVDDLDEMYETAQLFVSLNGKYPKGKRAFATTLSGGIISLVADINEYAGLEFPAWSEKGKKKADELLGGFVNVNNPLDAWGSGHIDQFYRECLLCAANEESADMVIVIQDVPPGMSQGQVDQYMIVANAAVDAAKETDKPIILFTNGSTGIHPTIRKTLEEGNVPCLQGTREAMKAIAHAAEFENTSYQEVQAEKKEIQLSDRSGGLTEYDSKRVLRDYGIPCAEEILCDSADACVNAAKTIGYPVVMKVMSPDILHKTEAKALRINIGNDEEVRSAYAELLSNAKNYRPDAGIDGILVQEMAKEAVAEVIVGVMMDPDFGPAVVFGSGGINVEVFRDSTILIPPLNHEEALQAIQSIRGVKLLNGFRGKPKADVDALADTLVRVGQLAMDGAGRISALDINPMLVYPESEGVLAVDALLELK